MKIVDNYKRGSIIELPTNSSVTRDFMSLQELPSAIRLKDGSLIFQKIPGFKPIPFEKIGLYQDEYRRELPAKAGGSRP